MLENKDLSNMPWLASYGKDLPANLKYEDIPLFGFLDNAAKVYPKRKALIFKNYKMNFAQLHEKAEIFASNLRAQGLVTGDRVSIMLPNLPQTIIAFWGVLKAGGVVVMTNPLYMETELVHQIHDADVKYMIVLDMLWPKIDPLRDRLGIKKYFVTRISDGLGIPLNWLYYLKAKRENNWAKIPFDGKNILPWKSLTKKAERFSVKIDAPSETLALLQYTGGTTGISKGVMLTHGNLACNVQQILAILAKECEAQHTFLALMPYFHVYGLTTCLTLPTALGATIIPFPRYVPQDVLTATDKYKPTIFPGAPSIYISLMQQKDVAKYNLTSIRYCISGSAPMPVEHMKRFQELTGAEVIEGFGMTEASPVTHLNPIFGVRKAGSIGVPFPDTEARVVDMEVGSIPLPPHKAGELIIRGPQVMKGYLNRPDDTANTLRNGWLYTGDIATMDDDGYFYIVDRKKDMILVGGYNVYPREIDEVLHEHPDIKEAVSVGIPHPTRGEIIKAYVVLRDGAELTSADVISYCRAKLANYKIPKKVEFRDGLPKTAIGKVLRRMLRDEEEIKMKKLAERTAARAARNAQKAEEEAVAKAEAEAQAKADAIAQTEAKAKAKADAKAEAKAKSVAKAKAKAEAKAEAKAKKQNKAAGKTEPIVEAVAAVPAVEVAPSVEAIDPAAPLATENILADKDTGPTIVANYAATGDAATPNGTMPEQTMMSDFDSTDFELPDAGLDMSGTAADMSNISTRKSAQ